MVHKEFGYWKCTTDNSPGESRGGEGKEEEKKCQPRGLTCNSRNGENRRAPPHQFMNYSVKGRKPEGWEITLA
jgi:hypothetical protein